MILRSPAMIASRRDRTAVSGGGIATMSLSLKQTLGTSIQGADSKAATPPGKASSAEADQLAARDPQYLILPHHGLALDDGGNGPARDLHAVEGRPAAGRGDPGILDPPPPPQIDQREVSVVTRREPSLSH